MKKNFTDCNPEHSFLYWQLCHKSALQKHQAMMTVPMLSALAPRKVTALAELSADLKWQQKKVILSVTSQELSTYTQLRIQYQPKANTALPFFPILYIKYRHARMH